VDETTNEGFEINETENMEEALKEVTEQLEQTNGSGEKNAQETSDKYVRLYADFENYRKRVNKDKEDLIRYGNESLIYELLPALDSLDLALKHASGADRSGLVQGVEMTLKELLRTLEKFGLTRIEAAGKPFDPALHHAMIQVEREDIDEKMVAEEMRPGYLYRDKVLRPSLVAVSVKPAKNAVGQEPQAGGQQETVDVPDEHEIKINKIIEEN